MLPNSRCGWSMGRSRNEGGTHMNLLGLFRSRRVLTTTVVSVLLYSWARWGPMDPLFDDPHSTVLLDRDGIMLGATVASDAQWRMPAMGGLPPRFVECLLQFEDRRFRQHLGVHLPSLMRAAKQNLSEGRTVSGGSTISMQVARMSGKGSSRTYGNKVLEILLALRMEMRYSKDEILQLYADNAPFGGNVVGLEAAAWRWFQRDPWQLSWAECATLAVLPNAPARIHPGRKRDALLRKRNRLLDRLLHVGELDSLAWSLALEERLPEAPRALPRAAPHLLATLERQGSEGQRIRSTLDASIQARATELAERHALALRANEVHNTAILIMDVPTGEVLAYVGNLGSAGQAHAGDVDIIRAPRSTGSLLKPFLYASMLQQGERMPDQLVADLPTRYQGFAPRNFDQRFSGAVRASQALARSLNVPAVRALHQHGVDRTLRMLRAMGLEHLDRSAEHYGLALIVGGSESTLWELTGAYASLARIARMGPRATSAHVHPPMIMRNNAMNGSGRTAPVLGPAAAFHTLEALRSLDRPDMLQGWGHGTGSGPIAWKTGTSFGHRDAWAIGVSDRYAVGVWTGNASGEGRPALTGTLAAAPLLFELFGMLPNGSAVEPPYDHMERMSVCRHSGLRAGPECDQVDSTWVLKQAVRTPPCPYHRSILVDASGSLRTRPGPDAFRAVWFVLPPAMEHYYMIVDPSYKPLPAWAPGVLPDEEEGIMELIYPDHGARILVPVQLHGRHGEVVLEAAHREKEAAIHWDLNGEHRGTTIGEHRITVDLEAGPQKLTLADQAGRILEATFSVERGRSFQP